MALFAALLVLSGMLPFLTPTPTAAEAATAPRYFTETSHYISGRFREYWEVNGGLSIFGLPIAEARIEETISSILAQERSLFEYIIVDACSPDDTLHVIRKYEDQVRWISEPDDGLYDAMNKGIAMSSGRYLYFIGAGDRLRPGVLSRIAAELPDHDRGVVYGNFHVPNDETNYYGRVSKWFLLLVYDICHQSAFYGREVFDLLGTYDIRYRVRADYAINVQAFCDRRIEKRYVDMVIADYAGGGISALNEDKVFSKEFPALARRCLGVSRVVTPDPVFSFLARLRFNSSFREFGRRLFQFYASAKRLLLQS